MLLLHLQRLLLMLLLLPDCTKRQHYQNVDKRLANKWGRRAVKGELKKGVLKNAAFIL